MNDIKQFLIDVLFALPIYLLLARFFLQGFRCPFTNPLYQWMLVNLRPVLGPLERVIPRFRSWNLAVLVLLYLVCTLKAFVMLGAVGAGPILTFGLVLLLSSTIGFFMFLVFIRIVLSFVQPREGNPLVPLVYFLTEPLMAPLRRLLPATGPLDLSPILLFLIFMLIQALIIAPLAQHVAQQLMLAQIGG